MNSDIAIRANELDMSPDEYVGRLVRDSVFFATEVWHDRDLDQYGKLKRYERRMIRWACEGRHRRRGVLAPRGIGKTYFCACIAAAWYLLQDPEHKIMFVSKSISHAQKTVALLQGWIRLIPFLQHLYAGDAPPQLKKKWGRLEFDVLPAKESRTPSVFAVGIGSQLPGSRASLVIADDVETDETSKTKDGQENIEQKVGEFFNISKYGDGEILYAGTFFPDDSIYSKLAAMRREDGKPLYEFRTWPMIAPTPAEADKMIGLDPQVLDEIEDGTLRVGDRLFPHRHTLEDVADAKAHSPTFFARQYMLIPGVLDDLYYPLKLRDLIVFPIARDQGPVEIHWGLEGNDNQPTRLPIRMAVPDSSLHKPIYYDQTWAPWERTIQVIDPAGRGEDSAAYCIASALNGMVFIKELMIFPPRTGLDDATMATMASRAQWHRVSLVLVEENFGGGSYTQLLMPYYRRMFLDAGERPDYPNGWTCSIEDYRVTGQKEARICDALEGPMARHRVVVDTSVAENQEFQFQVARMSRDRNNRILKHDDGVDCFAAAVGYFKDTHGRDPETEAQRRREEAEERYWEAWLSMGHGDEVGPPRWFQHPHQPKVQSN